MVAGWAIFQSSLHVRRVLFSGLATVAAEWRARSRAPRPHTTALSCRWRKLSVSDRKRPLVAGVNGPLMARRSGSLISPGLEFLPLPSAARRRALEEHDDHQDDRNRCGIQDLACENQIYDTGDGHHRHRVALGRGGRVAVPPARGAEPCFASQQRLWPHGHRLRRSLPQTLREQVNEASDRAGTHNENGPDELGQEMSSIGCPKAQQAEDVEDNHEQDAEQDRNQHDRGRKSFHVPNVTLPPGPCPAPPRLLTGARSLRVGAGSRLAEAIAKRRPEGGLDAVPASWTIEAEEDGPAQHQRCLNEPD